MTATSEIYTADSPPHPATFCRRKAQDLLSQHPYARRVVICQPSAARRPPASMPPRTIYYVKSQSSQYRNQQRPAQVFLSADVQACKQLNYLPA